MSVELKHKKIIHSVSIATSFLLFSKYLKNFKVEENSLTLQQSAKYVGVSNLVLQLVSTLSKKQGMNTDFITGIMLAISYLVSIKNNTAFILLIALFFILSFLELYSHDLHKKVGLVVLVLTSLFQVMMKTKDKNQLSKMIMTTIVIDTLQKLVGISLPQQLKVKVTHISPNKTYGGYIGGFILSKLVLDYLYPDSKENELEFFYHYLLSITGDLFFSYQKRKLGLKDYTLSNGKALLGEQGGVTDRLASHFFVFAFLPIIMHLINNKVALNFTQLLYVPNIIGFARVFLLYLSNKNKENSTKAISYYTSSYLLDVADGWAARRYDQSTKFGYWLDMITDRLSTSLLLFKSKNFLMFLPFLLNENLSHGVVLLDGEITKEHQKCIKQDYSCAKLYLEKKPVMFFSMICSEILMLQKNYLPPQSKKERLIQLVCLSGFLFRHLANFQRAITSTKRIKEKLLSY